MHYIWKEWKENIRGKGLWLSLSIIVLISVSILVRSTALSFDKGFYVLLINLFDTIIYFIPILCLFIGAFSIFQEKEQKTLIMLLTKKDNYTSFLVKKSLGLYAVVLGPLIVWFFVYLLLLKFNFQLDLKGYLIFVIALVCMALVFLQMGAAIGSFSRSRMQIIGYTIFIWFYFFFLHDFILLSFLPDVTHENVKLFSSVFFLNPLQSRPLSLIKRRNSLRFFVFIKCIIALRACNLSIIFLARLFSSPLNGQNDESRCRF